MHVQQKKVWQGKLAESACLLIGEGEGGEGRGKVGR